MVHHRLELVTLRDLVVLFTVVINRATLSIDDRRKRVLLG